MAATTRSKTGYRQYWLQLLQEALDVDSWGQSLEAIDAYDKFTSACKNQSQSIGDLGAEERELIGLIVGAAVLRINGLHARPNDAISFEQAAQLKDILPHLFTKRGVEYVTSFPSELRPSGKGGGGVNSGRSNAPVSPKRDMNPTDQPSMSSSDYTNADGIVSNADVAQAAAAHQAVGGNLQPRPELAAGLTSIMISIEKVGLKDAPVYEQGHFTVSVVDENARCVGVMQDTPYMRKTSNSYVHFGGSDGGCNVYLQTAWEKFQSSWAVFFEFKHYKSKKDKISTRCFAILDYDELVKAKRDGPNAPFCLELYQKPTDFSRKKLRLFTEKPLYLLVRVTFQLHR